MKVFRTFVLIAAGAALVVVAGATSLFAQVPNFPLGFSQDQLCPPPSNSTCLISVNGSTLDDPEPGMINYNGWLPSVPVETSVLQLTQNSPNQRGSAWFNTPQPVTRAWTTTFKFRLIPPIEADHGDGFAFVIQKNGEGSLTAIGGFGGGLGYGTRFIENPPSYIPAGDDSGIPNSLAIEFDTYENTYDPDNQHVAVQSCGAAPNSPNHSDPNCTIAVASISPNTAFIADGSTHTVRIDYTPPSNCGSDCPNLFVYLDGSSEPVLQTFVDIDQTLALDGTPAYVGFTAATRGVSEEHDVVSWTFSPSLTQQVTNDGTTTFDFQGGFNNGGYDFTIQLNTGSPINVQVTPILMTQADCNALVQTSFSGAQCLVYHNADGLNGDFAVMFEVLSDTPAVDAELGSDYHFELAANPFFSKTLPLPGWLKGHGDSVHPCTPVGANPLFQSNQIESFTIVGDPNGTTKGKSGGTLSCWVATYNTPNETPSVVINTPADGTTFAQGASVASNFACTAVNAGANSPTGPYLTVPTTPTPGCTATVDGGAPFVSGSTLDTSTLGPHTFVATVTDSGSDTVTRTVHYNVVGSADLAILKVGPPSARVGSKVTYLIGVGDLSGAQASGVTVTDILPANTTFVSVSASKVNCSVNNGRLSCATSNVACTTGGTVSCNVGTLMPLSWSSLNGATIKLTVQLGPGLTAGKTVKNTATVGAINTDPHTGNNSSTATTQVTAH